MKRRILLVVYLIVIPISAIVAQRYVSMESMVQNELRLRDVIQGNPLTAWLIGFVLYFLVSLLPGTSGKSIVCGWLYGFWQAVVMVDIALTGAALIMFSVSRYAMRDSLHARFPVQLERLQRHLDREGTFYLLLVRMAHAPFVVVNFASGALPISARNFWWTTQLGLLPGTAIFVFVGTRLPTLGDLHEHGAMLLLDPPLIAALVATGLLPIIVRWLLSRWPLGLGPRGDASQEAQSDPS